MASSSSRAMCPLLVSGRLFCSARSTALPLQSPAATHLRRPSLTLNNRQTAAAPFSTSCPYAKRHTYVGSRVTRDNSKRRGESMLRRSGTRWRLSVSDEPLPRPTPEKDMPRIQTDADHGLWQFFHNRERVVNTPKVDGAHGRPWTVEELRAKSWEDLHKLWWVCVKERNRIATADYERDKSELGFGDSESSERDRVVRKTMRGIKHVLTERYNAWEDAVKLAEQDPEVDLSGNGPSYTPTEYLVDEPEEVELSEGSEVVDGGQAAGESKEKVGPAATIDPSTLRTQQPSQEPPRL